MKLIHLLLLATILLHLLAIYFRGGQCGDGELAGERHDQMRRIEVLVVLVQCLWAYTLSQHQPGTTTRAPLVVIGSIHSVLVCVIAILCGLCSAWLSHGFAVGALQGGLGVLRFSVWPPPSLVDNDDNDHKED